MGICDNRKIPNRLLTKTSITKTNDEKKNYSNTYKGTNEKLIFSSLIDPIDFNEIHLKYKRGSFIYNKQNNRFK